MLMSILKQETQTSNSFHAYRDMMNRKRGEQWGPRMAPERCRNVISDGDVVLNTLRGVFKLFGQVMDTLCML